MKNATRIVARLTLAVSCLALGPFASPTALAQQPTETIDASDNGKSFTLDRGSKGLNNNGANNITAAVNFREQPQTSTDFFRNTRGSNNSYTNRGTITLFGNSGNHAFHAFGGGDNTFENSQTGRVLTFGSGEHVFHNGSGATAGNRFINRGNVVLSGSDAYAFQTDGPGATFDQYGSIRSRAGAEAIFVGSGATNTVINLKPGSNTVGKIVAEAPITLTQEGFLSLNSGARPTDQVLTVADGSTVLLKPGSRTTGGITLNGDARLLIDMTLPPTPAGGQAVPLARYEVNKVRRGTTTTTTDSSTTNPTTTTRTTTASDGTTTTTTTGPSGTTTATTTYSTAPNDLDIKLTQNFFSLSAANFRTKKLTAANIKANLLAKSTKRTQAILIGDPVRGTGTILEITADSFAGVEQPGQEIAFQTAERINHNIQQRRLRGEKAPLLAAARDDGQGFSVTAPAQAWSEVFGSYRERPQHYKGDNAQVFTRDQVYGVVNGFNFKPLENGAKTGVYASLFKSRQKIGKPLVRDITGTGVLLGGYYSQAVGDYDLDLVMGGGITTRKSKRIFTVVGTGTEVYTARYQAYAIEPSIKISRPFASGQLMFIPSLTGFYDGEYRKGYKETGDQGGLYSQKVAARMTHNIGAVAKVDFVHGHDFDGHDFADESHFGTMLALGVKGQRQVGPNGMTITIANEKFSLSPAMQRGQIDALAGLKLSYGTSEDVEFYLDSEATVGLRSVKKSDDQFGLQLAAGLKYNF